MESRHPLQCGQGNFECIALHPFWRLAQQDQCALSETDAQGRAEVQQRGFCGLGVIAQRDHRLPSPVEVRRQLRGSNRHAGHALTFEGSANLAMEVGAQ
ncbi:hypothetical protein D3C81_1282380 [compost metagenome]